MNYKEYKQKQKEDLEVYKQKLKAKLDEFKEKLKIKLEKFKLKTKAKTKNNKKKSNKRKRKGGVVSDNFLEEFLNKVIDYLKEYDLYYDLNDTTNLNFVEILQEISDEELEYLKRIVDSDKEYYKENPLLRKFDEILWENFLNKLTDKTLNYYNIRDKLVESIKNYKYILQEIPQDNTEILISIICKLYYEIYQLELQHNSLSDNVIFNKIFNKLNNDEINEIRKLDISHTKLLELLIKGILTSIKEKNISVYNESYSDIIKSFIINKKDYFVLQTSNDGLMNVNKLLDLLKDNQDNQDSQYGVGDGSYEPLSRLPNRPPSLKESARVMREERWRRAATGEPLGNRR